MELTIEEKIGVIKIDIEILARAIREQQKFGQISPETMEELEVMK